MRVPTMVRAMMVVAGISMMASVRPLAGQDGTGKKAFVLPHVLEAIGQAIDQPDPAGLSPAELQKYTAETDWLKTVRSRLEALGTEHGLIPPRDAMSGQASGKRMHKPLTITMEFEALQKTIASEGRQFDTLSNASKARHDLAMSIIQNLKA